MTTVGFQSFGKKKQTKKLLCSQYVLLFTYLVMAPTELGTEAK